MMAFLTIFERLTTIPEGSPKLVRRSQNVVEHFPKISEDCRNFRGRRIIIDIFTSEDMEIRHRVLGLV